MRLELFSPATIRSKFPQVKSVADSVAVSREEAPSLLTMARENRKSVVALVALHIAALDKFLSLKNRLSNEALDFIAEEVVDSFGGALSFIDVDLVMRKAKRGEYGEFYERMSAPQIIGWFREYFDERLDAAEAHSIQEDKRRYSEGDGAAVLRNLGYKLDEEGRVYSDGHGNCAVDRERVARAEEARKEERGSGKDEEYMRFKADYYQHRLQEI